MKLALILLIALVVYLLAVPVIGLPAVVGLILAAVALAAGLFSIGYTVRDRRSRR